MVVHTRACTSDPELIGRERAARWANIFEFLDNVTHEIAPVGLDAGCFGIIAGRTWPLVYESWVCP